MPASSLGPNWLEVVGDSQIVAGELQIPAGGMVIAVPHADRGAMKVDVTMIDLQPDKIYRIIINWTNTPSVSYSYVEYECTSTLAGTDYVSYLRVGSSGGGDAYEIEDTYTAGTDSTLVACRTPGGLYGGAEHSEVIAWTCESEPSALYAGLANASASGDIEFDDFIIYRYEGTDSPIFPSDPDTVHRCYICVCECDGYCLPDTLTLTFTATGYSYCVDGEEITLTYQDGTSSPMVWSGSASIYDSHCGSVSTYHFCLACEYDGTFTLWTDWNDLGGWTGGYFNRCPDAHVYAATSNVECYPLDLTFGPFSGGVSPPCPTGGCDTEIYIDITE